ncbi:dihydroneopterin triphosphate diphosphatase [endosymbiont of unidentified scaly snail isolate Monju]|uniref:dihydroneopterin triphosphate diphosphatase n=1 Tax=endosymbiont of unidentified scaly snail isolate Monju TaxID=1248727 RepID=UPI00038924B0|nr:dihydroneopterin triphosphate diphosphatase [endosymbiont of unidentified scaly snail isolate Monju]BAN69549.1 dATP pyrophosphohydrolase [endosymbiont of unidentified scaly snail isolate Monju]
MTFRRPESVLVLVCNDRGETLLLERRSPAGFWQSVTGGLRRGESLRMAARRELFEETGFDHAVPLFDLREQRRFPIVPPWRARYAPEVHSNLEHGFLACVRGRRIPRLRPAEHVRWRWLPAREAAQRVFSWTNREAIERHAEACRAGVTSSVGQAGWASWAQWPPRRRDRGG